MPLTVHVDGAPHPARPGQTVAAVLLSTGRVSWRETRHGGRPRGVFCGIGVCYDCLVTVNGLAGVRACRREVREGDRIETASPAAGRGTQGEPSAADAPRAGAPGRDVPGAIPQPSGWPGASSPDAPAAPPAGQLGGRPGDMPQSGRDTGASPGSAVPPPAGETPSAPPPDDPPGRPAGTGSGA
ncbi:(2Fe-2S)-binding protein [Streptomyces sp. NPDC002536]